MRRIYNYPRNLLVLITILFMGFSCSVISTLSVDYSLPPSDSGALRGKEISLAFEDARKMKGILKGDAIDEFESFSGNISLSLKTGDETSVPLGLFDPGSLFIEAFKRRFEEIGVKAVAKGEGAPVLLTIVLKEFSLDLVKRKWMVKIGYEAVVKRDGRITYRNNIQGEGERLKLVGTTQADALVSEIFTDVVNRLDLERVYENI